MTKKTYHKLTSFLLCLLMLLTAFTPAVAALNTINTAEDYSPAVEQVAFDQQQLWKSNT